MFFCSMVGVESAVLTWGPRVQLSSCIVIYNFRAMPVSAISKYARPQGKVMRQCRLFETSYQFQTLPPPPTPPPPLGELA